jgi:hypothetical protein
MPLGEKRKELDMAFAKNLANDKTFFGERTKKGRVPLPPLRTFTEMAAEFGLTIAQLRYQMAHSEHNPPAPRIRSHSGLSVSNKYYDPAEMRAWWKRHNRNSPDR